VGGLIFLWGLVAGEDIGDVHRTDGISFVPDIAIEVHEAGKIGGNDVVGAGLKGVVDLLIRHGHRDGFEFDGKAAAEPTANIGVDHLQQLQPPDFRQQFARLFADAAFAECGTGVVVGSFTIEAGADVFDTEDVDKKGGELEDAFLGVADVVMQGRIVEEGCIVIPDKADAAGRRSYNIVGAGKIF
jgi:hypothetical protein